MYHVKTTKVLLILMLISISILSCKKEKTEPDTLGTKCEKSVENVSAAAEAFISNPNSQTCEAYKQALLDYVNGCASYVYYNESYEAAVESIDCSIYDQNQ